MMGGRLLGFWLEIALLVLLLGTAQAQSISSVPSASSSSASSSSQNPVATGILTSNNGLPQCAYTCHNITVAETQCLPSNPAQIAGSSQTAYHDCFCHSNLTTSLSKTGNGICDKECPNQQDRDKIRTWYLGYCNQTTASASSATSIPSVTSSKPLATSTASQAKSTANPAPATHKLSKGATIGVAVGASIGAILVAAAAYFPVFLAAKRSMRSRTPSLRTPSMRTPSPADRDDGGEGSFRTANEPMDEGQIAEKTSDKRDSVRVEEGLRGKE